MVEFDVIIPARHDSIRLPGKPLIDISGKAMINRVVERSQSSSAATVYVATDSDQIAKEVTKSTTARVCKTSSTHENGTDRVTETVELLELDDDRIIVNVQGDEPLIVGDLIDKVAEMLHRNECASVATAARPFKSNEEWSDESKVKCILDKAGHAIYFSRTGIPWHVTGNDPSLSYHHIGIYAYRVSYLKLHSRRPSCALELRERLEQLRVLYYGDKIAVHIDESYIGFGVDTVSDLERIRDVYNLSDNQT